MIFEWTPLEKVTANVVEQFDCGEDEFNYFLKNQANEWASKGYAVTYVAVDEEQSNDGKIQRIYGFAAINATGLLGKDSNKNKYLSCAEIRLFAVSKVLRGEEAVDADGVRYSYKLFQTLMQELYHISTSVIGFCAVTLNSNTTGLKLYKKFGFMKSEEYLNPEEEEKIDLDGCTPLIFSFMDEKAYDLLFLLN